MTHVTSDDVVFSVNVESRKGITAETAAPLKDEIAQALEAVGVTMLWRHQAQAIDLIRAQRNVAIATSTASGKSLCYQIPAAEMALERKATCLYICPTRALATDQAKRLAMWLPRGVTAACYDSDTPTHLRRDVRHTSSFILTNPDMVHVGILPSHDRWARFFARLSIVVVDEGHAMRGVFGTHVALILRRLRRVAKRYGASPVFVVCSATIGNPRQHASALIGDDCELVDGDSGSKSAGTFQIVNPPQDPDDGSRASANFISAKLLGDLASRHCRAIAFSRSRVGAELVARYASAQTNQKVASYRSGYLPEERREIEQGLATGDVTAVSATNALELGIDISGVDAVICNGFPGTVSSVRQQIGRAGRAGADWLGVLVCGADQLDQHYAAHPDSLLDTPSEAALINPSNVGILRAHIACAAWELPVAQPLGFADGDDEVIDEMVEDGDLVARRGGLWWSAGHSPASDVDIRSAGGRPFRIVQAATGRLIGTTDSHRAVTELHPGAVYMHKDETFKVDDLDFDAKIALVDTAREGLYTQTRTETDISILNRDQRECLGEIWLSVGSVKVTLSTVSYDVKQVSDGKVLERVSLDLPPQVLETRAIWYTFDPTALAEAVKRAGGATIDLQLASLHAAEHASIGILPVFAMCDRNDIGGLSTLDHRDEGCVWFIYDGYPFGAGIADHAFVVAPAHLAATRDSIRRCGCRDGCPNCVVSPKCGNFNEHLFKAGAVEVLDLAGV